MNGNKIGNQKTIGNRLGTKLAIGLLVVAMFAAVTPVQAYQELTANANNVYTLQYMTYGQDPNLAWALYYTPAGVYKGYLLRYDYYAGLLDTDPKYKRPLSISSYLGTIKGTNMADMNGQLYGQCVSFVKSVSKSTLGTNSWKRGRNVLQSVQNQPVARGAAIAKFKSDGGYDCCGSGHVAIFDKYYYVNGVLKGIVVWDQNYVYNCGAGDCGLIGWHVISTTNSGSTSDAAAYYVVLTDPTIPT